MNDIRYRKAASRRWMGTAVIVLLFAFSAPVNAQNKKEEKKGGGGSAPARSSAPAAQPAHQAPSQPAHQAPAAQPAHQAPSQPAHQAPATQPARQTPSMPARQTPTMPSGQATGQPNRPTMGQPNRPTMGQPAGQNAGQPGRPNNGQQFGRPAAGQPAQSPGQPGRPNNGQQFGRPATGQPGAQAGGRQFGQPQVTRYPNGQPQTIRTANGGMVNRDQSGRVREVHTPGGAVITHRPDGVRNVAVVRPGNRVIVTNAQGRGGYAQRPLMFHNQAFVQRTYYVHGVAYARVYRPFTYRGVVLNMYTPVRFYRPGFYAYAYSPWARPVVYGWGWASAPWFGFYGGFFAPYPQYLGPAYWLTDYMFAMTLQEAYQERMDANLQGGGYPAGGPVALTPAVKQAVADEVHRQLDEERAEGQSMAANTGSGDVTAPVFSDNVPHVFVVSSSLMVDDHAAGCPVSEGDVLQLRPGSENGPVADVVVLASKGADCRRGGVVSVQLQDLQEMQNHMRETMDQGLAELQSRQGKGGLPPLPAGDAGAPVDSPIAAAVQPDQNVSTELSQAAQEANSGEQAVVDQSGTAAGNAAGPVTISLGQSMADVESSNGKPDKVIDLGAKKIYVYKDLKITFTDGKVSDVQ